MSLILPSYQSGFAPRDYEPAYPSLWQGCVAAYAPLLGPTGLVLRDAVGKNDGVLTNGPTWDISGGRYALGFDGTDDYVDVSKQLVINYPFSLSLWFKVADTTTTRYLMFTADIATNNAWFGIATTSTGVVRALEGDSTGTSFSDSTQAYTTDWQHAVAIFKNASLRIVYLNGVAGTESTATRTTNFALIDNVALGALRRLSALYSASQIDDARIYNRSLSDNEIRLLSRRRGIAYEPRPRRKWYFRGFSPKKKLLEAKITSTVPGSYQTGYAPRDGEPVYPELWKGCVGAWSAGLGPSNLLRDNAGKNHGTLVNGPTYQVSGGQYALSFDGTDDYVNISRSFYGTGSIAFWVKTATEIAAAVAFGTNASSANLMYIGLGQNISGTLTDELITAATVTTSARIEGYTTANRNELFDNNWHHVCVLQRTANSSYEFYLDGNKKPTTVGDASLATFGIGISSGDLIQFGSRRFNASQGVFLNGQLDDIRLYNRGLSDNEIKLLASQRNIAYAHRKKNIAFRAYDPIKQVGVGKITSIIPGGYHTGVGGVNNEPAYPELTRGLVGGWCPSLGVTGGMLRDNSGQGNHGTLTNMDPGTDWVVSGGKYALDFDGVNDWVDGAITAGKPIRAVSLWLNPASTINASSSGASILSLKGPANANTFWYIGVGSATGSLSNEYITILDDNNYREGVADGGSISGWTHFAASWNGTRYSLYLNGILKTSITNALYPPRIGTTTRDHFAIASLDDGTYNFAGQIDDVRVYERSLTDNEIALLASRRGIGYDYKTHRSYSKTQSSGLRKKILTGLP